MILCCGEALIDFVPIPGMRGYRPCPGGSIYNIAVGLGRLHVPVGYFGKVSTDFFGDLLMQYLEENGVATTYTIRAPGETLLAFVSLPDQSHQEPQYLFYAHDTVDRNLTPADLPSHFPETIEALQFGSISLVMEPGAASYEALMRRESGRRVLVFDPNVRPGLIADRTAYRERFEGWLKLVDLVKLSHADLAWLYPDTPVENLIAQWLKLGPSLCVLTLGDEGARGYTAHGGVASVPTAPVKVADTVGAGDAFLAATLAYLSQQGLLAKREALRGLSASVLTDCLSYANRAAAINCSRPGANPPYKHEMEE